MLRIPTVLLRAASFAILLAASLCAQNKVKEVLIGDTKVTVLDRYGGTHRLPKPTQALVYEFDVPKDVITLDHSAAAKILSHDPIAKMKRNEGRDESPASVAANVQAAFAKTLIGELNKTPIPASAAVGTNVPRNTLTVRGHFTDVNLGNKTKRMMIGFGRGASDVKAHVTVSLTADHGPILLAEFHLRAESGKKPGAAATMGVGSAAASIGANVAMDGKATVEGDTVRMAKAVAEQIESILHDQHWM